MATEMASAAMVAAMVAARAAEVKVTEATAAEARAAAARAAEAMEVVALLDAPDVPACHTSMQPRTQKEASRAKDNSSWREYFSDVGD